MCVRPILKFVVLLCFRRRRIHHYKVTASTTHGDSRFPILTDELHMIENKIKSIASHKSETMTALKLCKEPLSSGDKKLFYSFMLKRRLAECSPRPDDYKGVAGVLILKSAYHRGSQF